MKLKPITVIMVLFLVVASLLVSGCTTSTNSNQAASSASSAASTTANTTTNTTKSASATPSASASIIGITPTSKPTPTPPPPTPTPTPPPQPVTGSFGQSAYTMERGGTETMQGNQPVLIGGNTITVTATVSNWASNPTVYVNLPDAHGDRLLMQSTGNGGYSAVVPTLAVQQTTTLTLTLTDNGAQVAHATWTIIVSPTVIR
jgi:outer membrane murein-binding lipoprotein Lpp